MKMRINRRAAIGLMGAAALTPAHAQQTGTVRIVAGFAAGGSSDAMARLIAERMGDLTGRRVIVENRAGAGGRLAAEEVKRAAPDGTTILLANTSMMVLAPLTVSDIRYDAIADFAPVAGLADFQVALATGPMTGARTLPELLAWVRANPDKANYGVPAAGSLPHLTGLAFAKAAASPMQVVLFQGGAPISQQMIGGHLAMGLGASADFAEQHRAGTMRIVGMTGTARHPSLPDVPTFGESGLAGLDTNAWNGLFLPQGASAEVVEGLRSTIERILAMPDLKARLEALSFVVAYQAPAAVLTRIRDDQARFRPIVDAAGLRR
jgi:tripartite-type tricarboxylate transporter receptor subunit TctC